MPTSVNHFIIGADNTIQVNGLIDSTNAFVGGATITGLLKSELEDSTMDSVSFTVADSASGNYSGLIPSSVAVNFVENKMYILLITATSGSSDVKFRIRRPAKYLEL